MLSNFELKNTDWTSFVVLLLFFFKKCVCCFKGKIIISFAQRFLSVFCKQDESDAADSKTDI